MRHRPRADLGPARGGPGADRGPAWVVDAGSTRSGAHQGWVRGRLGADEGGGVVRSMSGRLGVGSTSIWRRSVHGRRPQRSRVARARRSLGPRIAMFALMPSPIRLCGSWRDPPDRAHRTPPCRGRHTSAQPAAAASAGVTPRRARARAQCAMGRVDIRPNWIDSLAKVGRFRTMLDGICQSLHGGANVSPNSTGFGANPVKCGLSSAELELAAVQRRPPMFMCILTHRSEGASRAWRARDLEAQAFAWGIRPAAGAWEDWRRRVRS